MKLIILSLCILILSTCSQNPKVEKIKPDSVKVVSEVEDTLKVGEPEFPLASISTDFMRYWTYHVGYVKLYHDFLGFDEERKILNKKMFLQQLTSKEYLPLLLHSKNSTLNYKLVKIPESIKDAGDAIGDYARRQLEYLEMEGKTIPNFKFKDLNGVEYSSANTKGKILLLKCWFVACVSCIEEMPKLNELVSEYKNHKDILFVSLASDKQKSLHDFLKQTEFNYAIVPNQEKYMKVDLGVKLFPTHFIIDRNGKIIKVVEDANEVADVLQTEVKL
jgi:peroxiredoxin